MIFCKTMINNGVDKTVWMRRLVCAFVFLMKQDEMFSRGNTYIIMNHHMFAA